MYYQLLEHLPKIPNNMVLKNLRRKEVALYQKMQEVDHIKKIFPRVAVDSELSHWIIENITSEATSMDIAVTVTKSKSYRMWPHTDSVRLWTLMYLIEHGGSEHRTVFYKHRDFNFKVESKMNFNYEEVIEVDSIQIPLKTWTIINAHEIHSVENIPGIRIAFQLGMQNNPWS